jgi:chorismate mutase
MAKIPALVFILLDYTKKQGDCTMVCRGVRGATTVDDTEREFVLQATRELLAMMIRLNEIDPADVASAIFTTTTDITSAFPATAARQLGWLDVPLMCAHEMGVEGALGKCIRILLHWNTDKPQSAVQHVYLRKAKRLRPDKSVVLSEEDIQALNRWIEQHMREV